jgi:hypothetical protein
MNLRALGVLGAIVVGVVQPLATQSDSHTKGCAVVDWPVLQVTDPAYLDAVDLAQALNDHGVTVQCIAPSKMASMFDGLAGAVLYRTNQGSFDALFVPKPQNFDNLQIHERQEKGRHLYSFAGHPKPWAANLIDASGPVYFIKSRNRLIVLRDSALATQLGVILTGR